MAHLRLIILILSIFLPGSLCVSNGIFELDNYNELRKQPWFKAVTDPYIHPIIKPMLERYSLVLHHKEDSPSINLFSGTSSLSAPSSNSHLAQVCCGSAGVSSSYLSPEKDVNKGIQEVTLEQPQTLVVSTISQEPETLFNFDSVCLQHNLAKALTEEQLTTIQRNCPYVFGVIEEFRNLNIQKLPSQFLKEDKFK